MLIEDLELDWYLGIALVAMRGVARQDARGVVSRGSRRMNRLIRKHYPAIPEHEWCRTRSLNRHGRFPFLKARSGSSRHGSSRRESAHRKPCGARARQLTAQRPALAPCVRSGRGTSACLARCRNPPQSTPISAGEQRRHPRGCGDALTEPTKELLACLSWIHPTTAKTFDLARWRCRSTCCAPCSTGRPTRRLRWTTA